MSARRAASAGLFGAGGKVFFLLLFTLGTGEITQVISVMEKNQRAVDPEFSAISPDKTLRVYLRREGIGIDALDRFEIGHPDPDRLRNLSQRLALCFPQGLEVRITGLSLEQLLFPVFPLS